MSNKNLYAQLRQQFPDDLDSIAIETAHALAYSWRDLERGSAMLANLLAGLGIPQGSRVAVQVGESVEAIMLYLATLRAGLVFLQLNHASQSAALERVICNAAPAVVVCSSKNFGGVSKIAFSHGVQSVFTLNEDRSGSLLDRAIHCSDIYSITFNQDAGIPAVSSTIDATSDRASDRARDSSDRRKTDPVEMQSAIRNELPRVFQKALNGL